MLNETDNVDDSLLVTRVRQDDKDAFKTLYRRYSKKIYFFSLKYLGNTDEAEELVQSIFINVWLKRRSLDPTNSVKSYVYKAAVNYIYNFLKKKTIHARFIESQKYKEEFYSNPTNEQVLFHELEEAINSVVATLPSQQRIIFRLSHDEGLTYKEIALRLNLSVRTIENQMYRALKTIRTILKEKYF